MLYPQCNPFRNLSELSGFWKFKIDPGFKGVKEKWYLNYKIDWDLIAVPGSWNDQVMDQGLRNYMGWCWYTKEFYIPKEWEDKRIWLRVGAATYNAKVWANGKAIGKHEGAYVPFQFEITNYVHCGCLNKLVVRVDNLLSKHTIPQDGKKVGHFTWLGDKFPSMSGDYFPYGGIQRPVIIYCTPQSYLDDVTVTTEEIKQNRSVVKCWFATVGEATGAYVSLGEKNSEIKIKVKNGEGIVFIEQKKAQLWSPATPYLYPLKIHLCSGRKQVDTYELSIGIRTIKVDKKQLLLNDKPIFLKGFNRHEEFPIIGQGSFLPLIIKDFSILRWIGANSMRTSHYPHSEEWMHLADRKGILIMDECPANALFFSHDRNARVVTPDTMNNHKKAIKEMIARDKNHPSVIMWSVANEPDSSLSNAKKYLKEIYTFTKSLDSTRPVCFASCVIPERDRAMKYFDVICLNVYKSVYQLKGNFEELKKEIKDRLDQADRLYKKPIMVTEFGADGLIGSHYDDAELWTEEYQARHLNEYCDIFEKHPHCVGEFIWVLADFKTQQHFSRVIYNCKGVFSRDRLPKMAAYEIRKRWNNGKAVD